MDFIFKITIKRTLNTYYWWASCTTEQYNFIHLRIVNKLIIFSPPLLTNLVITLSAKPFTKWSLDCTIKLARRYLGNEYIIVAIDYATKWIKVKPFELL